MAISVRLFEGDEVASKNEAAFHYKQVELSASLL
jgi:hypothetical protein